MIRSLLIALVILINFSFVKAQKSQKIAYIDMEYILENVPEYVDAQTRLKKRMQHWQKKLDGIKREIEVLKTDLGNEKALLTKELIQEREEDIEIKELDLKNLQATYFGPNGDIFLLRRQLVKPIQDQVYNAVQEIAVRKKYDMVLDKSTNLIMLYTNNKYDISELVLNKIVKNRKIKVIKEKRAEKIITNKKREEELKTKAAQKKQNNEALKARVKEQQQAKEKKREAQKKAAEERKRKRQEEIERRKKEKTTKTNNNYY